MDLDNRGIPYRTTSDNQMVVETRPIVIEEWLDTLPYADFGKTCKLVLDAMRDTNQESMKFSQRLELITLYNQPYQYFIESQLDVRSNHTQKAILSLQSNLDNLKELSLAMGVACRISIDEALNRKTLWVQAKPPVDAILMAMKYFSEALVCCYLQYYPTPKTIWRELNFLYDFSESIGKHNTVVNEIGTTDPDKRSNITNLYKRIVLTSLVDPYHLPFGAIWEIYEAMSEWADQTEIIEYKDVSDPTSIMVIDLKHDLRPVPYSKFNKKMAKNRPLRMLYGGSLVNLLKTKLKSISTSGMETVSIPLAPQYAEYVLENLVSELEQPHKRNFSRQKKNLMVRVAHGFSDSYYYVNGEQEFDATENTNQENVNNIVEVITSDYIPEHHIDVWELQDYSQGGYSIRKELKSDSALKVGELLAIYTGKNSKYNLGIVSWLMIRPGNMYQVGIEVIAREAKAVRIRKDKRLDYSRAFISGDMNENNAMIIAEQSVCVPGETYELNLGQEKISISVGEMVQSTTAVHQYSFKKVT